jgi:hypothetical protein
MRFTYDVLINRTVAKHFAGTVDQLAGHPYVLTYRGTTPIHLLDDRDAAEWVISRHNRDDRPDGYIGPSFSVGDAIRLRNPEHHIDHTYVSVAGQLQPVDRLADVDHEGLWSIDPIFPPT